MFISLHYRGQNSPSTEKKKQSVVSSRRLFRERNFSSSLSRPRTRKIIFYFWHYLFIDSPPVNWANYLVLLSKKSYFWTLSCSQLNQNADFKRSAALGSATDQSGFQGSTFTPCPPLGKGLSNALPYRDTHKETSHQLHHLCTTITLNITVSFLCTPISFLKLYFELELAPTDVFTWSYTNNNT